MATPEYDSIIKGGSVVSPEGIVPATVGISGEKIQAILDPSFEAPAKQVIDATGKYLLPGVIDPHAHITNRRPISESVQRETPSLAAGGVTTVIDFLASEDSYNELLDATIREINENSYIDMALHSVVMTSQHVRELPEYAKRFGVTSSKMYMGAKGARLYPTTLAIDDGIVYDVLETIAQMGPPAIAMVHAENWEISWTLQERMEREGRSDPAAWTESKPNICEVDCLYRIATLAGHVRCPVYVVHLSTKEAPGILREARARGVRIFGETCPHYLMIHKNHPQAITAKYNPAIKEEADNAALWEGLSSGTIDCMGSDHIPVRWPDKEPNRDNIWNARGGVPGSGTILPLLLSEGVNKGRLRLEQVATLTSYNPARLFGLFPRKGTISIGSDADIVLVDLEKEVTVSPELLQLDFTLFDGLRYKGWPVMTMVRGKVVAKESTIVGRAGHGRYAPRKL